MLLTTAVYQVTREFPREETFGLRSQLRRSAISIPSNIAEGHGRMNPREFKHFLFIARGSNCELQMQLEICEALEIGDAKLIKSARTLSDEVERMLYALLRHLRDNTG